MGAVDGLRLYASLAVIGHISNHVTQALTPDHICRFSCHVVFLWYHSQPMFLRVFPSAAKAAVEEHCGRLISLLLQTVAFPGAAAARLAALECLSGLSLVLPPAAAAEHRSATIAAARRALDDKKRSVRQAAIQCRAAWAN